MHHHRNNDITDATNSLAKLIHDHEVALIGDTLDFETLGVYDLQGTVITPQSVVNSLDADGVFYHIWAAVKQTLDKRTRRRIPGGSLVTAALERLVFELASVIFCRVDGPHFTFVDPRKHNDAYAMVRTAKRLISLFEEKNVPRSRVVVSIPGTMEGIRAAQELEREHKIRTNIYLVSNLLHAAACAEAGATTITVPVGRLLNWYERRRRTAFDMSIHPGVETIQSSLEYFKLHGIKTKVIGSDFRSLSEIAPLTGFDAICISKDQADGLRWYQIENDISSSLRPAALLRARQAQYPTNFLSLSTSTGSSFMDAMSAETRAMVGDNLFVPLGEMECHMDVLEEIVAREVVRQFELKTFDLKSLFASNLDWEYSAPHRSFSRKDNEVALNNNGTKKLLSKRYLARDLGFEKSSCVMPGHDVDDVF